VRDPSNNGNDDGETPLFREFRLGTNSQDDENPIVINSGNTITIELNPKLAFIVKDMDIFLVCDKDAAFDIADNPSLQALEVNIIQPVDPDSHTLLHATPA
jgi:hypothetical protein